MSRGLGDVYKRQTVGRVPSFDRVEAFHFMSCHGVALHFIARHVMSTDVESSVDGWIIPRNETQSRSLFKCDC